MDHNKALKEKQYITLLSKTKCPKKRNLLVDMANKEQIDAISEIILNTLKNNVPLKTRDKNKLRPYKQTLRNLAKKSTSLKKRKHILKQRGGFLSFLLPLALTTLANIIPQLLHKRSRK